MAKDTHSVDEIKILITGEWSLNDVEVFEVDSTREINASLDEDALKSWNQMMLEAKANDKQLWDCELYRLESVSETKDILKISLSTIPFSIRLGMNHHTTRVKELGISYAPKGMYCSCLVKTNDDKFVFIEKSEKFYTHKKYAWVGGVFSRSEMRIESAKDLFEAVGKEICEELGLLEDEPLEVVLNSGYLTENWNTCLLFTSSLPYSSEHLYKVFSKNNDGEAKNIVCIPHDDLSSAIVLFDAKDQKKFDILNLVCSSC